MHTLDAKTLLKVWEGGAHASASERGLMLLSVAVPHSDPRELLQASIGHRDAWLLSLRETLFGSRVECVMPCPACGQHVELDFRVSDVRAPHAVPGQLCEVQADGLMKRYRLPTSEDLLAVEVECDSTAVEQALLQRCLVDAGEVGALKEQASRPIDSDASAVAYAMSQTDPQAEVLLDVACPACGHGSAQLFDIVDHLWRELDHWARGTLQRVHALASRYGWSEDAILAMSPMRRRAYLDLVGAA